MVSRGLLYRHVLNSTVFQRNISSTYITHNKNDGKESKLKVFAMSSYMRFMKRYEDKLEKRFPSAMQIYRIFKDGIKSFFLDLKSFFKINMVILGDEENLNMCSRKEIELYNQMPKDMRKITPVLLLSALPLANYLIFPIAYMYPRTFLTSHFWTPEQKQKFMSDELNKKLQYQPMVLNCLKNRVSSIKDKTLQSYWGEVLNDTNTTCPTIINHLKECKSLFVNGPYSIKNLYFSHTTVLLRMHGVRAIFSRGTKLSHQGLILKEMDNAIIREGGLKILPLDVLKSLCFIRGLYTDGLNEEEIRILLDKWITLSKIVNNEDSFSLLLHAPAFLNNSCTTLNNVNS